jgi:hypothetical protein
LAVCSGSAATYPPRNDARCHALHRRVAETLRDQFANAATAGPETLAHHFTQAGLTDAAIEWWGKAGDQTLRRSAFQEAIATSARRSPWRTRLEAGKREAIRAKGNTCTRPTATRSSPRAVMARRRRPNAWARESAASDKEAPERLAADYGLWTLVGRQRRAEQAADDEGALGGILERRHRAGPCPRLPI